MSTWDNCWPPVVAAVFQSGHVPDGRASPSCLGTIFGALPGVSATMAVALGLTFTYTMEPIPAIVFLVAIYCSSITGRFHHRDSVQDSGRSVLRADDVRRLSHGPEAARRARRWAWRCSVSAVGGLFSALCDVPAVSARSPTPRWPFGPSDLFAVTFMGLSILTCLDSDHVLTCHHLRPAGSAAGLRRTG